MANRRSPLQARIYPMRGRVGTDCSPRFARGIEGSWFPLQAEGTLRRGLSTAVFCELWLGDWYNPERERQTLSAHLQALQDLAALYETQGRTQDADALRQEYARLSSE